MTGYIEKPECSTLLGNMAGALLYEPNNLKTFWTHEKYYKSFWLIIPVSLYIVNKIINPLTSHHPPL